MSEASNVKTNTLMKLIYAILMTIFLGSSYTSHAQSIRENRLDRRERKLERRTDRVERRNPNGVGRRDDRLERRTRRNDRRQDRTEDRINRRRG